MNDRRVHHEYPRHARDGDHQPAQRRADRAADVVRERAERDRLWHVLLGHEVLLYRHPCGTVERVAESEGEREREEQARGHVVGEGQHGQQEREHHHPRLGRQYQPPSVDDVGHRAGRNTHEQHGQERRGLHRRTSAVDAWRSPMSHADPTFCMRVPMFDANSAMNSARKTRCRNGVHGDAALRLDGPAARSFIVRRGANVRAAPTASHPTARRRRGRSPGERRLPSEDTARQDLRACAPPRIAPRVRRTRVLARRNDPSATRRSPAAAAASPPARSHEGPSNATSTYTCGSMARTAPQSPRTTYASRTAGAWIALRRLAAAASGGRSGQSESMSCSRCRRCPGARASSFTNERDFDRVQAPAGTSSSSTATRN